MNSGAQHTPKSAASHKQLYKWATGLQLEGAKRAKTELRSDVCHRQSAQGVGQETLAGVFEVLGLGGRALSFQASHVPATAQLPSTAPWDPFPIYEAAALTPMPSERYTIEAHPYSADASGPPVPSWQTTTLHT